MEFFVSKPTKSNSRECIMNWYRTRRSIFILLCYESLLFGIELTVLEPTEFFYYKTIMKVKSPIVSYACSLAINVWSSLMASIFVSHIVKRYQVFTSTMLFLSFISVVGHCLYFVTKIPAVAIMGRFVAGLGKATNLISMSYVRRLYPEEDLFYKLTILSNFVTFGSIIGPVLTYVFLQINFNMGTLNLNYGNSPGFYMFICKLVLFLSVFLFMDDIPSQRNRERFKYIPKSQIENLLCCSNAEEDENENFVQRFDAEEAFLKENDKQEEEDNLLQQQEHDEMTQHHQIKKKVPLKTALSETLKRKKVLAVLLTLCVHGLTFKIVNSLISVEASKYLHWRIEGIAGLSIANAILGTLASVVMAFCFSTATHLLNLIGGTLLGLFSLVLLGTIQHYVINMAAASLLFCLMSFFNVISSCLMGLSARMILEHLTDQKFKSFTDLLRTFTLEVSYFFGALLIMLVDLNLIISMFVGLVLTLTSTAIMITKLKSIWV